MESSAARHRKEAVMDDPRSLELDLEHLTPSQFVSLTFPNPHATHQSHANNYNPYPHPLLRFAVLDSPIISPSPSSPPVVAAMLVPVGREHDWIFSTQTGHLHLLLSSSCSRLILVGNLPSEPQPKPKPYTRSISSDPDPDPDPIHQFQSSILPLLLALSPKSAFTCGIPHVPFLSYHDDVARIVTLDHLVGPVVGEMLVEDVELDGGESRRRLRFKRMPNLVQSQVRLVTDTALNAAGAGGMLMFRPELGSLVQPYLGPMVAGLSLLALGPKTTMRALCLGVGGGDLLMCLRHHLGFNVVGVEADDVVLRVAKRHFGLIEDESLVVVVHDGIELMEESESNEEFLDGFDVIMVDLDSGDALSGISAPPVEFVKSSVLQGASQALRETGIMVVNVIPPSECFYKRLVHSLREVFAELYEIDVGNGENYVLIAVASPVGLVGKENNGPILDKLKKLGVDRFLNCINKI